MTTVNVDFEAEAVSAEAIVIDLRNRRRPPKDPFPELPKPSPLNQLEWETFTQTDVAKMFNDIDKSIISKDCKALNLRGGELGLEEVWQIYVLRAWMRLYGCKRHRESYVKEIEELQDRYGDEADRYMLAKIAIQGATREHFEQKVADYLATVKTSKLIN